MRGLRDEMRRTLVDIENKVDAKLSKVVQKIEVLEVGQKELAQKIVTINAQVNQVENLDTKIRHSSPHVRGRSKAGKDRYECLAQYSGRCG